MIPGNTELKIRAYLTALAQLERAHEAGLVPHRSRFARLRQFVRLRAQELGWTLSRILRQAMALTLPNYVAWQKSAPPRKAAWQGRRAVGAATAPASPPIARPRLFLDMTSALRLGKTTGIQRVVREIARNCWSMGAAIPVEVHNGKLFPCYRHPQIPEAIEIEKGDTFVLLDASWNHLDEFLPMLEEARARGARIIVCLYDILPLTYPAAFPPPLVHRFEAWMEQIVLKSDGVLAISRAAAESLRDYLAGSGRSAKGLPIGWWRLGADFCVDATGEPSAFARRLAMGRPYFLGVGTLEPRKGYPLVLDALEKLWAQGVDATYVIAGGKGWGMTQLERRIEGHEELNRRLFWLDRASDADLALLYRNAHSLVLASVAEGFGLPIVEAAHYGTPVIATDIPVFREAAGDSAQYFRLLDSDSLAERMAAALEEKRRPPVVSSTSWRDSAAQLACMARGRDFQTSLD